QWRSIGPVKKTKSEAIWVRFRAACDRFFARYADRHNAARAERIAAREAICVELEGLAASNAEPVPVGSAEAQRLLAVVRGIRTRWQQETASHGVPPEQGRALDQRFAAALAAAVARWPEVLGGTDLDTSANAKRLEVLVRRIEELAASLSPAAAQSDP